MAKSRRDDNGGEKFFGAVTRSCRTVFVEKNKRTVREKITQQGVTKNNVAMFECYSNGRKIKKKLIHKPAFKLAARHHVVLENACFDFLEDGIGA